MFKIVKLNRKISYVHLVQPIIRPGARGRIKKLAPAFAENPFGARTLEVCGSILWNKLAGEITDSLSLSRFKLLLKDWLYLNPVDIYKST